MEERTGLIGKVENNEILHFKHSKNIAKLVFENTKKGISIYEGMIAIKKENTKKLNLENLKGWENYIQKHINTIREENNIKREDFEFICAIHEKDIKKLVYDYTKIKLDITTFYSDKYLDKQEEQHKKEIEKIVTGLYKEAKKEIYLKGYKR